MTAVTPVPTPFAARQGAGGGAVVAGASARPQAWVVFTGRTDLGWLKLLRQGFRHCFVLLRQDGLWLRVDPLAAHTEIEALALPPLYDLPAWYEAQGCRVVPVSLRRGHRRPAPVALFSCVEAVKRVLGLHAPAVLTPWQLYRHLTGPAATP